MNLFENIIINTILMLFLFLIYLFYMMYNANIKRKTKDLFFDFILISSLYLLIMYNNSKIIILYNVPLIIAYLQNKKFSAILLSLIIIINCYSIGYIYIFYPILNYIILYLLFLCKNKLKETAYIISFIIIEIIFYNGYCYINNIEDIARLLRTVLFVLATFTTIFILKKGQDIVNLNMKIKEFEKEKKYRDSLFKITHEIKNPIAVCKSYLDMFDFNNKDHERYIPIVKEEINKILLLLQDFLSMDKIKINKDLLDINLLIEDTKNQMFMGLKIDLECNILDDEVFIDGDYNRLSQVLINIIMNSIEANATNIKIGTELINNSINIIIEDNGDGISAADLKKIYEPFYTTKKNGTGLGVSLSKEIIEAHNGTIYYESKECNGTKVIITLPLSNYN